MIYQIKNKMKNILISPNIKIVQAMKKLGQTGEKCLIVVDANKKLLGTITDGDIRRGILKGLNFQFKVFLTVHLMLQ